MSIIIKTFEDWKEAIRSERAKMNHLQDYLNDKGIERYQAFRLLENLASFCSSATELANWIETRDGFDVDEIRLIQSSQIMAPLAKLHRISVSSD